MARKLNCEEKRTFVEAIREKCTTESDEDRALLEHLSEKRDTAMHLSPELGAWFALQLPGRLPS